MHDGGAGCRSLPFADPDEIGRSHETVQFGNGKMLGEATRSRRRAAVMPSRRCCREWMSFPMPSRQRCRCRRASRQQDTAKAKRRSQRSSRSRTSRRLKRPKVSRGFIASSQTGTTANLIRYEDLLVCFRSSSARLPIWWILVHRTKIAGEHRKPAKPDGKSRAGCGGR